MSGTQDLPNPLNRHPMPSSIHREGVPTLISDPPCLPQPPLAPLLARCNTKYPTPPPHTPPAPQTLPPPVVSYPHQNTQAASQPVSQPAIKLPSSWVLAARRNFQAQASKFNITGIQSEATTTAATKWPSSGAWTVAEFSTFELGRPCGPAKPKR